MKINPSETISLVYEFSPFHTIAAKNYKLQIAIFYTDMNYEFSNMVYEGYLDVLKGEEEVGGLALLSLIFTGLITFLIVFTIYVKIEQRFTKEENRKKPNSKEKKSVLGQLKEIILAF